MRRLIQLFLPVLFPSWRFFQEIGPSPRIEVRQSKNDHWVPLWTLPAKLSPAQFLFRLMFNADWNRKLYLVSTCIRYSVEPDDFTQSELTKGISELLPQKSEHVDFRIVYHAREGGVIGTFVDYQNGVSLRSREL